MGCFSCFTPSTLSFRRNFGRLAASMKQNAFTSGQESRSPRVRSFNRQIHYLPFCHENDLSEMATKQVYNPLSA